GVDARWYLQTYPDVAASGMDPVAHYLDFGWREGRDPRPDFSTAGYLAINDELAKAQQNPLIHFLRNSGRAARTDRRENEARREAEGRGPSDDDARGEAGVDARWYLQTYPDVAASGMDPAAHYLDFGWREGRDPRPDFSTAGYLAINDELAKAQQNPLIHFLR